jgi:hypothetical protein
VFYQLLDCYVAYQQVIRGVADGVECGVFLGASGGGCVQARDFEAVSGGVCQ